MDSMLASDEGLRNLTINAPFALRGFLDGTGTAHRSVDGLRRQPANLKQLRGHKTVTGSPYNFSFHRQHGTPPSRSRALHGSRVASEAVVNRPLSPHLVVKKPQFAATYSISHRIFGGVVASLILASPILVKFSVMFDV